MQVSFQEITNHLEFITSDALTLGALGPGFDLGIATGGAGTGLVGPRPPEPSAVGARGALGSGVAASRGGYRGTREEGDGDWGVQVRLSLVCSYLLLSALVCSLLLLTARIYSCLPLHLLLSARVYLFSTFVCLLSH
jgi:hypothetical protein